VEKEEGGVLEEGGVAPITCASAVTRAPRTLAPSVLAASSVDASPSSYNKLTPTSTSCGEREKGEVK